MSARRRCYEISLRALRKEAAHRAPPIPSAYGKDKAELCVELGYPGPIRRPAAKKGARKPAGQAVARIPVAIPEGATVAGAAGPIESQIRRILERHGIAAEALGRRDLLDRLRDLLDEEAEVEARGVPRGRESDDLARRLKTRFRELVRKTSAELGLGRDLPGPAEINSHDVRALLQDEFDEAELVQLAGEMGLSVPRSGLAPLGEGEWSEEGDIVDVLFRDPERLASFIATPAARTSVGQWS